MWPWRQKNLRKQTTLWVRFITISCVAHIVFLFLILFVYADSDRELKFIFDNRLLNQDISFLLMESYKRPRAVKKTVPVLAALDASINGGAHAKNVKNDQKSGIKNGHAQKMTRQEVKKPFVQTAIVPATKKSRLSRVDKRKKAQKLKAQKKKAQKLKVQKNKKKHVQKKVEKPAVKEIQKKAQVQKVAPQKMDSQELSAHQLNKETVPGTLNKLPDASHKMATMPHNTEQQTHAAQSDVSNNTIQVPGDAEQMSAQGHADAWAINVDGQVYDAESLLQRQALEQELERCWKIPVGVDGNSSCEIKVYIDADGAITDMQMARSSGILMYDVAARAAMSAMQLPKWANNKYITITFK